MLEILVMLLGGAIIAMFILWEERKFWIKKYEDQWEAWRNVSDQLDDELVKNTSLEYTTSLSNPKNKPRCDPAKCPCHQKKIMNEITDEDRDLLTGESVDIGSRS